jgi:hypothetical protein
MIIIAATMTSFVFIDDSFLFVVPTGIFSWLRLAVICCSEQRAACPRLVEAAM